MSDLVGNPEDRFSCIAAQLKAVILQSVVVITNDDNEDISPESLENSIRQPV